MRFFSALLLFFGIFVGDAQAQTNTGSVPIAVIRTGWSNDLFAIETGATILNPAGCLVQDGYLASIASPGYKTFYSSVLMAFALGKNVALIISNTECSELRPKIIGVTILK